MKQAYTQTELPNPLAVLRKAGYSFFKDPLSHEESFVLRLTPEFYPRFHLYVAQANEQIILSLHLDQKKSSYGEGNKHSGEYEGPVIEKELKRIDGWIRAATRVLPPSPSVSTSTAKRKSWWQRLWL